MTVDSQSHIKANQESPLFHNRHHFIHICFSAICVTAMMSSTQPPSGARIACAVATTFLSCQLLFGFVHFGLQWCRCRRTSSWYAGLPWSLGITHSIVFVAACLQNIVRAIVLPRYFDDSPGLAGNYVWDGRLILLYYESCVLSFFIIIALAATYLWMNPQRAPERCDDTVEGSSVENEDVP